MKVSHIVSRVDLVGDIWQPGVGKCAQSYALSGYDVENMREEDGTITRESVRRWIDTHTGDFSSVDDFAVTIGDGEFDSDWHDVESEIVYGQAMWGEED